MTGTSGDGRPCAAPVSTGLSLGGLDVGLPDRGRGQRGRPRSVDLGHVQPHSRQDARRRHGRCRMRFVSPPRGGSRSPERARRGWLPLLGGLAEDPADGPRAGQPTRPRLLPRAGRGPARTRDHAGGHRVSLGASPGPRGSGRLGKSRHGGPFRRIRATPRARAGGPGGHVDHAERAPADRPPGLPRGDPRARQDEPQAGRRGDPPPPARPRAGHAGDAKRASGARPGRHLARCASGPPHERRRARGRGGPRCRAQPDLPRARVAWHLPGGGPARALAARGADPTRRHADDLRAGRLPGRQLLLPVLCPPRRLGGSAPRREPDPGSSRRRQLRPARATEDEHGLADRAPRPA